MSSNSMTLTATWEKLRALGAHKPTWHITQANKRGYSDFLSKDNMWHRLASQGHGKYEIREIK